MLKPVPPTVSQPGRQLSEASGGMLQLDPADAEPPSLVFPGDGIPESIAGFKDSISDRPNHSKL